MDKEKKIKILYITYLGILEPIPKSQVLSYLFELSMDMDIHLLSFEKIWLMKEEPNELRKAEDNLRQRGIIWHRMKYHKHPRFLSSFFDIFLGFIMAFYIVIKYRIYIVHCRSNIPIAIGFLLKLFLPIKILYDRRGIMGQDHTEHSGWRHGSILHRISLWFEKIAIRRSDAIVVLTDRVNNQLRNDFNLSFVTTIPCCVNLELFSCRNTDSLRQEMSLSGKFIIVYTGSVGTYNLLNEMFDFFKEFSSQVPNAHFLIMTQNKNAIERSLAKRGDIDRKDLTIVYVQQDKIQSYLSLADVGLIFRRTSLTAIAASPTKFGEYLACGLPVISTSKIGDLEEIIKSSKIGVILGGYSSDDYRIAITRLLSLLEDKVGLKNRCRKVAEDLFSLRLGVDRYRGIYNNLAHR